MGISERKEREREGRRKLVLETTKRLILERGVDAVTMNDIAKGSELSKAALYLFFTNKDAILKEIFDEAGIYFCDYVESRLPVNASGIEAIRTIWMSYLEVYSESNELFMLFGIKNRIAPNFPFVVDEGPESNGGTSFVMYSLIAKIIKHGVVDGTLDSSVVPGTAARMILLVASGIVENAIRLPRNMRDSKFIFSEMKAVFEIFLRGLASETCDRKLLVLPMK